jgi:hypothetical protein
MSELEDVLKSFKLCAKQIDNYEKLTVNELADGYCDATDNGQEDLRDAYYSALVLRFWYKINKLYSENLTLNLDKTDYFDWISNAILMACDKDARAWRTNKSLNAQQVINQVLSTRFVAAAYYDSNLQKNQGKLNTISLDDYVGDEGDGITVGDMVADDTNPHAEDEAISVIQNFIDANKIVEAIIFDNIAFKDCYKHEQKVIREKNSAGENIKYTKHISSFWPFKLVKELNTLDIEYGRYFISTYSVSPTIFKAGIEAIQKANNQKKYKMIGAALKELESYAAVNL